MTRTRPTKASGSYLGCLTSKRFVGPRMKDARRGKPVSDQLRHAFPCEPAFLAAPPPLALAASGGGGACLDWACHPDGGGRHVILLHLGRLTLSRRERMVVVEPRGPGMVLFTLRAAGEVRAPQFGSAEGDLDLIFFDCFSKRAHLRRPGRANPLDPSADQGSVDRQDHGRESDASRHACRSTCSPSWCRLRVRAHA